MATIVNNPQQPAAESGGGGGSSFLLGIIVLIVFVALFIIYILPRIGNFGATQVNIPDKVNINVQQQPAK